MYRAQRFAPGFQRLEERTVPALFGTPWLDGDNVTVSFVPDGTDVNGTPSSLFQMFQSSGLSDQIWQKEVVRAFLEWTSLTNLNVGIVRDSGLPIGAAGASQGDAAFGDIRVSARPLSENVLAITVPPGYVGGTRVGDIIINTAKTYSIGGANGTFDLYTCMLQETGHSLGVGNSTDVASPMYEQYLGVRTGLAASDVATIKALYGTSRTPDNMESIATAATGSNSGSGSSDSGSSGSGSTGSTSSTTVSNNSITGASEVKYTNVADEIARRSLVVRGDVTTTNDIDYYKFKTPMLSNGQGITIQITTSGISMLAPRLLVYNKFQNLIGMVQTTNPLQGQLSIFMPSGSFAAGTDYYVRVDSAASGNQCRIGSYQLRLIFDPNGIDIVPTTVQAIVDQENNTISDATNLQTAAGFAQSTVYKATAALANATDLDFYKFVSPILGANQSQTMTVTARAVIAANGLPPRVSVYDSSHQLIDDVLVLVNGEGTCTVQLRNAASQSEFYVSIASGVSNGLPVTNTYQLQIDFRSSALKLEEFGLGTLTDTDRLEYRTLESRRSQAMHYVLSASGAPTGQYGVRLTIHDKYGAVLFDLFAKSGATVSGVYFLGEATYTLRFQGVTAVSGAALPDLDFSLVGATIDDPIGPDPADPNGGYNCDEDSDDYYGELDLEDPSNAPDW